MKMIVCSVRPVDSSSFCGYLWVNECCRVFLSFFNFPLPSMKSSSVWARFCIRPRQFLVLDVAANVVVVVMVGTVVVLAFDI